MGKHSNPASRRTYLKYLGAAGIAGLAGCIGADPSDSDDPNGNGGNGETETVVIGSNHPLSGDLGGTGTRMDNAIQLAAMVTNEN
ncbi:MAG: hypothetical protein QXG03_14145, partial [Halalkalicoccus sp.]